MADVFTVLAKDHEEVKGMLAELEKGPTRATGASEEQLALRKKMAETLIIEESKHEAVEEMYFWPAVRERVPYGDEIADKATGQEQEAKEVLQDDEIRRICVAGSTLDKEGWWVFNMDSPALPAIRVSHELHGVSLLRSGSFHGSQYVIRFEVPAGFVITVPFSVVMLPLL